MKSTAFIATIFLSLSFLGCIPAKEETPAPAPAPSVETPAAPEAPAPQAVLSKNYLDGVLALYLDDLNSAKTSFAALAAESTGEFKTLAQATGDAKDLKAMRESFKPLSDLAAIATDLQLSHYSKDDMQDLDQELENLSESELLAMLGKGTSDE